MTFSICIVLLTLWLMKMFLFNKTVNLVTFVEIFITENVHSSSNKSPDMTTKRTVLFYLHYWTCVIFLYVPVWQMFLAVEDADQHVAQSRERQTPGQLAALAAPQIYEVQPTATTGHYNRRAILWLTATASSLVMDDTRKGRLVQSIQTYSQVQI